VDVAGTDYLVGALSYGDIFTLGGTGLATPIEYMRAVQDTYPVAAAGAATAATPAPGAYSLREPVHTRSGEVRGVVIAASAAAGEKLAATTGQPVVAPLGIIEIGGARPGSAAYERVAAKFARTGMLVRPASGDGSWVGAPTPALAPGSPCAILFSQGAVWVGAAGTVTYVDGDTAMLFGHPFAQFGEIEGLLTGGYVEGVWPSSYEPYKLIAPRDVKGTCVQDRAWGVEARIGGTASLFPVRTTLEYDGRALDDESAVEQWLFTSQAYAELPGDIAWTLAYRLVDQDMLPGAATTTTTVVVSDDTGTYTVEREDLWSDSWDVTGYVGMDAYTVLDSLSADPDGTLDVHVDSVSVDAAIEPAQRTARIESVDVPGGFKAGPNRIIISYYQYGSSELRTLEATLTLPEDAPLSGRLTVYPGNLYDEDPWDMEYSSARSAGRAAPPQTLAELVDDLNEAPHNSDLVVTYSGGGYDEDVGSDTVSVTVPTDVVFTEPYTAYTTSVTMRVRPRTVDYGSPVVVMGSVYTSGDVPVSIYRQDADRDEPVLVATLTARAEDGEAAFAAVVPGLHKTATIIAVATPDDGSLPGRADARVVVRARVRIGGAAPLRVRVKPAASGTARIQRKAGGRWIDFRKVKIVKGFGTVKLPKGTWRVRAKFPGAAICAAGTSRAVTVVVR
jgi:hypothetical protein